MRILFVTPCSTRGAPHEGKFVSSLSQAGYETKVFSFHYEGLAPGITGIPNVSVEYTALKLFGKVQRFLSLHILPKLKAVLREFKPDVIHAGNVWNDSFLSALSGYHPLLVMPYGSDVLLDADRSFLFRMFNTVAFRNADWVTCDAEIVKDKIVHDYGYQAERITVIPWGIDVEQIAGVRSTARARIRSGLSWEDNFVVIMTRSHEPVYGIEVFLNALERVVRERSEIRIIIVGGGSLHEKYRMFVRDKGLEKFVHFTGRISHAELIQTLQAADLYVSTSHSDGTSVSLMEAMASQLPVVVTDVPANLEWIRSGKNGEVVPRGDSEMLATKIAELSRLPDRNNEYGKANLEIVRARGDWKRNFREIEHIYRRLAQ